MATKETETKIKKTKDEAKAAPKKTKKAASSKTKEKKEEFRTDPKIVQS